MNSSSHLRVIYFDKKRNEEKFKKKIGKNSLFRYVSNCNRLKLVIVKQKRFKKDSLLAAIEEFSLF